MKSEKTVTLNWSIKYADLKWMGEYAFKRRENSVREILKMLNKMIRQKIN